MQYTLKLNNPLTHLIDIELTLDSTNEGELVLTLPVWRPGRYEAAYYSKNLRGIAFKNEQGHDLKWSKPNANTWLVKTNGANHITVSYQYFAFTMDAGNSWFDESLLYINFINCLIYTPDKVNDKCSLEIEIPAGFEVACALGIDKRTLKAPSYFELVDSPLLASSNLQHLTYNVADTTFNIWIHGEHSLDTHQLVAHFKQFSTAQIDTFSVFPEPVYHFLILALPYKFYHGVEHARSTVICLGPSNEIAGEKLYTELLGVSSHELFHAWNIIKIRPKEMMPYKFSKEVTFPTGYVAEGFTTYYGDLFLSRGHVFDTESYFKELNTLFNRHFWNFGRFNESVVTSSINLWVDGYSLGAPNKKSSIYVEGAMIALSLDLLIRKATGSKKSLDDVMRILWEKHGLTQAGYTSDDVQTYCEQAAGYDLQEFFNQYVYGTQDKEGLISELLYYVGCKLVVSENNDLLARYFGIRTMKQENSLKIVQIAPGSVGEGYFSLNDEIEVINDKSIDQVEIDEKEAVHFKLRRQSAYLDFEIGSPRECYFNQYAISKLSKASNDQKTAFLSWTGQSF